MNAYIVAFITKQNTLKQVVLLGKSTEDAINRVQELCTDYDLLKFAEPISEDCALEAKRIN